VAHQVQDRLQNCITYKTISTTQPAYLYSSLKHYTPSRTLRSSDCKLLFVPHVCTCFGSCSFTIAAPTIWNSLPLAFVVVSVSPLTVFSANSKLSSITLLSGLLKRPTPSSASDSAGPSLTLCALQIYLLTYLYCSSTSFRLKISNCQFCYASTGSTHLWNQLPHSFCDPVSLT